MKSFKEIIDYVIDHGDSSFHYHNGNGINLSFRWWLDKDDDITLAVDAGLIVGIYSEPEINLVLYKDDKITSVNQYQDHSELVKEINDLGIIP